MLSVSFIFEPKSYDDNFYALDELIQQAADATEGYLGREAWQSGDGTRRNSTYYWRDESSLKSFSTHPKHLEAKRQYSKWYNGYRVVVAEVVRSYGDGGFSHITEG